MNFKKIKLGRAAIFQLIRSGTTHSIKETKKDTSIFYQGPISTTIKKVKLLSLSTCCLSVSLGPCFTTAALHWFVSPYIHKLRWLPGSDTFDVEIFVMAGIT
ncbi:hypothetical protein DCAR_0521891 [Daucus carota subsp. sativus]|uniref:Uncharacterized protein n=1 Tax=Daucus carota subsp. sativus TaxID=79200 RepID=A0AAF0X8N5_DAUCS|nr:hypothetical protein DCAR_0521891 [Daucus carota subsp. sativus]